MDFLNSYRQLHRASQNVGNTKMNDEKRKKGEDTTESTNGKRAKMDCKDDDNDIIILEGTCINEKESSSPDSKSLAPVKEANSVKPIASEKDDNSVSTGDTVQLPAHPENECSAPTPKSGVSVSTQHCSKSTAELDIVKDICSSEQGISPTIVELELDCIQRKDLNDSEDITDLCLEKSISPKVHLEAPILPEVHMEASVLPEVRLEKPIFPEVHTENDANTELNIEGRCESKEREDSEVAINVKEHPEDDKSVDGKDTANRESCDPQKSACEESNEFEDLEFVEECYANDPFAPDRSKSDYYCELCDAHMNNLQMWESHVGGKRHAKNLKKEPGEQCSQIKSVVKEDSIPFIQKDLDKIPEPVVGLSFMCEYERSDSVTIYSCFLCGGTMGKAQTLEHVKSTKHRLNFFKEVEPEAALLFENVQLNKDAKENLLANKAEEWQEKHGRGKMEVRIEIRKDDFSKIVNEIKSSKENRTASHNDHSRSNRSESPDFRREKFSPDSRRDRYDQGSGRNRSGLGYKRDRNSPDRSGPSSRRERSPDLRQKGKSSSDRYSFEDIRGRTIHYILNLKKTDDIERKIRCLEGLSFMPVDTLPEVQVSSHVMKIIHDCVIYFKLRRLPTELQAAVAHKLIQENPTSLRRLNVASATMSSGSLVTTGNQHNSPGLNYGFNNPAMLNSGRGYSPRPMGGFAVSSTQEISYPNIYNGFRSSAATVRPGGYQNFNDRRSSDLRNTLDNIRNLQGVERPSSANNRPTMGDPPFPVPSNAFNSGPFQSQRPPANSSFHDMPYSHRHQ